MNRRLPFIYHVIYHASWSRLPRLGILLVIALISVPAPAMQTAAASDTAPRILYLTVLDRVLRDSDELAQAQTAQFSAAEMQLNAVEIQTLPNTLNRWPVLEELRRRHHAAVVVWVEESEFPRIYFYTPPQKDRDATIFCRTLQPHDPGEHRISDETIAIATGSTVVSLLTTIKHNVKYADELNLSVVTQNQTPPTPPSEPESPPERKYQTRPTLQLGYRGTKFAKGVLLHGGTIGMGILPSRHIHLRLELSQNAPIQIEKSEIAMKIASQSIGFGIGARFIDKPVAIELGLLWRLQNRRYTIDIDETVDNLTSEASSLPVNIHSIGPHLLLAKRLVSIFHAFFQSGVAFGINEKRYKINELQIDETILSPYMAKFYFSIGIFMQK